MNGNKVIRSHVFNKPELDKETKLIHQSSDDYYVRKRELGWFKSKRRLLGHSVWDGLVTFNICTIHKCPRNYWIQAGVVLRVGIGCKCMREYLNGIGNRKTFLLTESNGGEYWKETNGSHTRGQRILMVFKFLLLIKSFAKL